MGVMASAKMRSEESYNDEDPEYLKRGCLSTKTKLPVVFELGTIYEYPH
jgi:hypothetical protein